MALLAPLRRFAALDRPNQLLLGQALVSLALVSAAAAILPFRLAIRLGSGVQVAGGAADAAAIRRVAWGVARAARVVPWRARCLQQGLAVQVLLRRRGVDAVLRYGVGNGPDGNLAAHVWVTVGTTIVIGGDVVRAYREVASWPGAAIAD